MVASSATELLVCVAISEIAMARSVGSMRARNTSIVFCFVGGGGRAGPLDYSSSAPKPWVVFSQQKVFIQ
jgi:hypothetical protein